MRDRLGDGRTIAGAKVLVGCAIIFFAVRVKRIPAAHLGMGVDVNGNEVFVIHRFTRQPQAKWSPPTGVKPYKLFSAT